MSRFTKIACAALILAPIFGGALGLYERYSAAPCATKEPT